MKELVGYVANGNSYLENYGASIAYDGIDRSTDNTGITINDTNRNTASTNNYKKNTLIYGDGIHETSTVGIESNSWYGDYSYYPGLNNPFSVRGGTLWNDSSAGLFYFNRTLGHSNYRAGFRAVLAVS